MFSFCSFYQLEKVETKEEATTKEVDRLHSILYDNTGSFAVKQFL